MNINHYLTLVVFLWFYSPCFAQKQGLDIPNYTLHSPNVTSLGQYGEYPVEPSTGIPAINIPLHVIKSGKLELPLSLSYHASGIKVDQESSFVGLGWVLNAGGVVTRIIKDKPDDQGYGFIQTGGTLPDYNSLDDLQGAGTVGNSSYLQSAYNQDKEPDLFTVSANGLSDEFCLDNIGQFVSINLEGMKYDVDMYNKTFIIRDKYGNIYRFGKALDGTSAYETTATQYTTLDNGVGASYPGHPSYASSYYLTEMISADLSDTIFFKYKIGYYSDSKGVSTTRYILNDGGNPSTTDDMGRDFDGTSVTVLATTVTDVQIPDKIIFRNGSVEFSTEDDRLDVLQGVTSVPGKTRITGFTVYDSNRNIVKKVVFQNQGYFNRTGSGNAIDGGTIEDYRRKSLKLDAVRFYDRNNVFVNDYEFLYDETPLPPRNTTAQDFWGYYNGRSNSTLIPESFFTAAYSGKPVYVGDNRKSSYSYMKAAVLKKITFPTGGYTIYDYEPNYYLKQQHLENKEEQTKRYSLFAINRLPTCDPDFLYGVPANNTLEFQITEDISSSSADFYVMFTDYKYLQNLQPMTYRITNLSTGNTYYFEHSPSDKDERKVVSQQITIRYGDRFRLEARTNGATGSDLSICNSPFIESGFSYKHWVTVPIDQVTPEQAGGLRVKSISNFDINGNPVTKKTYEYGDTRYSVGVGSLITDPSKNFYNYPLLYAHVTQDLRNLLWFTSDSQVELGLNRGCPVDYGKVVEKTVSYNTAIANGKTEYYYSRTSGDYEPKSSWKYPYNTVVYPSWKRALLRKVIHYKFENAGYMPVKSVEYEYNEVPVKKIKTLKILDYEPDLYHAFMQTGGSWVYLTDNPERFYYYNYYVSCGKFLKQREITKEYVNGIESMVSERNFEYNKYHDLSKERLLNSKSEIVENVFKYTGDIDYTNLINKNMVSLPVQQESWVNGKVKAGSILRYNDFGGVSERYLTSLTTPVSPLAYNIGASVPGYYERKESLFYDLTRKTIKEIKTENSTNTLYLWSYLYQYPIAEIQNADYATIQSILGASQIMAFAAKTPTIAELQAFLAPLRTDSRLKTAIITTYTFNPLVGMTTMTDNRGQTTYYEYDAFNRLKLIKDQNGKILKQYDYQYQKPITQ